MEEYLDKLRIPFKLIDKIGFLEKKELEEYYSDENIEAIRIMTPELIDDRILPNKITPLTFSEILFDLCKTRKKWAKALGEVIIQTGELADANNYKAAIAKLDEFIEMCPSQFFRRHAQNRKKNFRNKAIGKTK